MPLDNLSILAIIFCALIVGASKTGIIGIGIISVIIMASVFPAKESTGILLPLLVFADVLAILFYRKYASWKILIKLIPFAVIGIIIGYFFMNKISNSHLSKIIGAIIILMLILNYFIKKNGSSIIFNNIGYSAIMGIIAGFTTMTTNAAGPIMSIYLLSMSLEKKEFIGTGAWYFFLLNIFKIPFSISLGLITLSTFKLNLMLLPVIAIGALGGYYFTKKINQNWFDKVIVVLALAGAVKLILK